jgi:hypothetical protein
MMYLLLQLIVAIMSRDIILLEYNEHCKIQVLI